jgi:hypothetical protein
MGMASGYGWDGTLVAEWEEREYVEVLQGTQTVVTSRIEEAAESMRADGADGGSEGK